MRSHRSPLPAARREGQDAGSLLLRSSLMRALFLSLLLSTSLLAQSYDSAIRTLEQFVPEEMNAQRMPGLSVAIVHGDFHWSRGFGFADIENEVRASSESSYRMASVTKPMTAVAILELAEQGKIDLDAEVQKYVPYFPRKAQPITIRQLLSHQGGISHYRDYMKEGRIKEPKSTREAIALFADFDLVAEPGTKYSYTTYGYNLLGAVIEEVTGKPYGAFLTDAVWRPLGMTSTIMDDPRAIVPHRVQGYVLENGQLRRSEYVDVSSRFAGGGTRSTVVDMIRFVEGLAAGKVLDRATLERAWTGAPTRDQRRTTYGLGFGVYSRNGRWAVAHTGSQQETRTSLLYIPSERFAVALASNFEDARLYVFEEKIISLFLGDPPPVNARADREADDDVWHAIQNTYSAGLMHYDRHGKALTADPRELKAAFTYFRDALTDKKRIANGVQPLAGEAFVKVGSSMAATLAAANGGSLDVYHREGALRFFADYARIAKQHRFDPSLNARIAQWSAEWNRAWTPELQFLNITSAAALDVFERHRDALAAATIKPDFTRSLTAFAEERAEQRDLPTALRAATLGVSLYPRSASLHGVLGILHILNGNLEQGTALLRTSARLDPNGFASRANLERIARDLPPEAAATVRAFASQ